MDLYLPMLVKLKMVLPMVWPLTKGKRTESMQRKILKKILKKKKFELTRAIEILLK